MKKISTRAQASSAPENPFQAGHDSRHEHPFSGEIEFTLTTEAFGKVSHRRARIEYGITPDWEYCDPKGTLRNDDGGSTVGVKVLARVDGLHVSEQGEHRQVAYDLEWDTCHQFGEGLVDDAVWNEIDRRIEERVQQEDAWRRAKLGLPACIYPPFEPSAISSVSRED